MECKKPLCFLVCKKYWFTTAWGIIGYGSKTLWPSNGLVLYQLELLSMQFCFSWFFSHILTFKKVTSLKNMTISICLAEYVMLIVPFLYLLQLMHHSCLYLVCLGHQVCSLSPFYYKHEVKQAERAFPNRRICKKIDVDFYWFIICYFRFLERI